MRKCRRKINVEIINEEVKGISSEMEEIKIQKFSKKSHVDIINEKIKGISSEKEDNGIRKYRRRSLVGIISEEVKGWIYSPKQQESSTEQAKTKEEIRL